MTVVSLPASTLRTPLIRALLLGGGLVGMTVMGIRLTDRADARRAVREALADGRHLDDSLTAALQARPAARLPFQAAIALEYLARAQAGLGSPFRLVDLARTEPRLPPTWRPRVAHAILSRLSRDTLIMRPAPGALDIAMYRDNGTGAALLRTVDSAVTAEGDSPLMLEVLRIAEGQASARGRLYSGAVPLLDAAALMAYDRVRAGRDVDRAITAASRGDGDLLKIIALWRAERRLTVERPLLAAAAIAPRRIAQRVPATLAAIEGALRPGDTSAAARPVTASPLPRVASAALRLLISVQRRPPQPQVRLSALDARTLSADRRIAVQPRVTRMLRGVGNEETLVMTMAEVHADTGLRPVIEAAALLASMGMRTLAQEAPYHPGMPAPRAEQVAARLGLASFAFGADVPPAWQPFYAREFAAAVDAMREVFPLASFRGLNVRIGGTVMDGALAVHDPRTRTLSLPLGTGFGAVGHELMHDLDWQSARDLTGRRGSYATDNASRGSRTLPLAAPIARLAEFIPAGSSDDAYLKEARRPAELLARGADWFLAAALARHGRINGVLSAVQDSWVRGYASAAGPDAFADHAAALSSVFDAMPMLAVRAPLKPRNDAERQPDLGMIARAAWMTQVPRGDSASMPSERSLELIPVSAGTRCSPATRLRLDPIRETAREVAAGFIDPHVTRSMRYWARTADRAALSPAAAMLRLGILGAPVRPSLVDSARALWSGAAWRALPCLLD